MRDPADVLGAGLSEFVTEFQKIRDFPIPRQQFIHVGQLSWDCESLSVATVGIYSGRPGSRQQGFQINTAGITPYAMDVAVTLLRPAPQSASTGQAPSALELSKATKRAASDATALDKAFYAAMNRDGLADPCDDVYYGGITWLGPQGGFLATVLNYSVQL